MATTNPVVGAFQADVQSHQLITPFGIYYPDRVRKLLGKVPRASSLRWMDVAGNMSEREATNFTYEFYEEGQWYKAAALLASSNTTAIPAGDVNLVLAASAHTNGGAGSYPIPTNTVVFPDGSQGYVVAVDRTTPNAHVVQVTPATSGDDIVSAATAASTTAAVVFYSNAQTEDSDAPESRVPQITIEDNDIQTFRETFRVTDHEERSKIWVEIEGKPYLKYKGLMDAADRFEMDMEMAFLIGKRFVDVTSGNYPVKTTQGLIPTIRASGETTTYDSGSLTPDLDDWENIILAIDANYGPLNYLVGTGLNLNLKLNRMLEAFLASNQGGGMIDFSPLGGKEQALSLNIQYISFSGRTFFLNRWDVLSHEDSLGAPGLGYRNLGIFVPLGKTKNPKAVNGSKNFENYCETVYVRPSGNPGEVRGHFKLFETGGNAMRGATEAKMRREIHHVAYRGWEMRNKEKFLLFEPGA